MVSCDGRKLDITFADAKFTVREALRTAILHARPLIESEEGAEATGEQLVLAEVALDKLAPLTEDEVFAIADVAEVGREYMAENDYAEGFDFPDDQLAAAALGEHNVHGLLQAVLGIPRTWSVEGHPEVYATAYGAEQAAKAFGALTYHENLGARRVASYAFDKPWNHPGRWLRVH